VQTEEGTLWIKAITSCMVWKIYKGYDQARVSTKSRRPHLVHTTLKNRKGDNIVIFVDDIIVTSDDSKEIQNLKKC